MNCIFLLNVRKVNDRKQAGWEIQLQIVNKPLEFNYSVQQRLYLTIKFSSMPNSKVLKVCTFVFNAGNDTPIKNPKTIPTKVVTISLILSLGFLLVELHSARCKCQ